jgi:hypothetical protein
MRSLDDVIKGLSAKSRRRVEARAKKLIKAETLRQLRSMAKKTQQEVATGSGITQYNVSRLEQRGDMLLSTLDAYIKGLGGHLRLIVDVPGIDPVELDLTCSPVRRRTRSIERRPVGARAATRF